MTMQRAVVIGGSIAGLCAARVLADYFDRVTVLDRDSYPAGPLDRAGVPHGRHVHALLAPGRADGGRPAALVVDAPGRGSKAPDWRRTRGLEPPAETLVDSHSGYATRWYRAPEPARWSAEWWWKGIWVDPQEPEHMTAGVLFPVEGGRWIVTIAGIAGHYPPSDEAGVGAALGRLRSPIIAHAVQPAEPISPAYSNRAMANRLRHYERWPQRLDGFPAARDP